MLSRLKRAPRLPLPLPRHAPPARLSLTRGVRTHSLKNAPLPSVDLPPKDWHLIWRSAHQTKDRVTISNPETAAAVAEALVPPPQAGEQGKVVIEAFPGPGALTRGLLKLPRSRLRKLIVLEDHEPYYDWLQPLEALDDRLHLVKKTGFEWTTYQALEASGVLEDVPKLPWDAGVHPSLQFVSHIPHTVAGEQLVNQFLRNIPERAWLFRYGCVPMSLIMGEQLFQRIVAPVGDKARCKLSVIAEAVAKFELGLPSEQFLPFDDHFHPTIQRVGVHQGSRPQGRRVGAPHVLVNVTPLAEPRIASGMLEKWDYVVRKLFVLRASPLKASLNSLAPGATSLLKPLEEVGLDMKTPVRKLTLDDWAKIVQVFDDWPFAPDQLMISDSFNVEETAMRR